MTNPKIDTTRIVGHPDNIAKRNYDKLRHIIAGIETLVSETEIDADDYIDRHLDPNQPLSDTLFGKHLRGNTLALLIDIGAISYDGTTYVVNI